MNNLEVASVLVQTATVSPIIAIGVGIIFAFIVKWVKEILLKGEK